ncbi:hypothetical protein AHAS_Ahas01G0150900 [Arachis hypogaea]
MFDYIKSDKDISLPYGMILTCIFRYFTVNLSNETLENKILYLKSGGVVKQSKEKGTRAAKEMILQEEEEIFPPASTTGTSSSYKYLMNGIVKDGLQEFINLTKQIINLIQEARKLAIQNENSFRKSQSRVEVLLKYIKYLDDEQAMSDQDEDPFRIEDEGSDV